MSFPALALIAVAALLALAISAPRWLLRRAQDRLARGLLEQEGARFKLLTRTELSIGKYRRAPGVLGLTEDALTFHGVFGETAVVSTARIQKVVTGPRLASGRRLIRMEALRITRSGGDELEFVLSRASASAWRSHLGLWAVHERKAAMDEVHPGR